MITFNEKQEMHQNTFNKLKNNFIQIIFKIGRVKYFVYVGTFTKQLMCCLPRIFKSYPKLVQENSTDRSYIYNLHVYNLLLNN